MQRQASNTLPCPKHIYIFTAEAHRAFLVQATWEYRFEIVWIFPLDFLQNSEFYLQQVQNHGESGWKDCSEAIHGRQVVPPAQHF